MRWRTAHRTIEWRLTRYTVVRLSHEAHHNITVEAFAYLQRVVSHYSLDHLSWEYDTEA